MSDVEETPVKRGRGRPKGSLNKKTLERRAAEAAALETEVPEVSVEETEVPEVVPAAAALETEVPEVSAEETEVPEVVPEPPRPKRRAKRVAPPEPPQPRARAAAPPAAPKPRAKAPPPRSYLEVLREGLEDARRRQKQERATRYDRYFAY